MLPDMKTFYNFAPMKSERIISAYKTYFRDFIQSLTEAEARKVFYVIDMLKTQERVNAKFVKYLRDEIYELRVEHGGNIFRVFFIFDDGNVVMLFNGFQKKTQKTPEKEINKAIQLKKEYYAGKK
jgi:putative addiction module killer protein